MITGIDEMPELTVASWLAMPPWFAATPEFAKYDCGATNLSCDEEDDCALLPEQAVSIALITADKNKYFFILLPIHKFIY